MQIEKHISYQIERQFPALYRENGRELVDFVKAYYDFLERQPNQSTYNSRRLFEYRDVDNTLDQLVLFFKNKFMNDLPYDEKTVRMTIKRILSLYRRKGNKESIELFFKMFYDEKVKIYYPAAAILKPSDSRWETQKYLQLFPESPFAFRDIVNQRIFGTVSKAEAIVEKAFFILVNGTFTPILFINNIRGRFTGFDTVVYKEDITKKVGTVYGSMDSLEIIDDPEFVPTSGNDIGDTLTIQDENGTGGKLLVSSVSETFSGEIRYRLIDGGWGYSKENTLLLVSNQIIFLNEETPQQFSTFDIIQDQFGNFGTVIGQKENILGVRLVGSQEFTTSSVLRDANNDVIDYFELIAKNATSPGPLFPEASNTEVDYAVVVNELDNTEILSIISDDISDFLAVTLNSLNFNDPPALTSMSGTDPVNLTTRLEDAFTTDDYEIGRIVNFKNINPGSNYVNDVFAVIYDPLVANINRYDQIVTYTGALSNLFNIGDEIEQGAVKAKIVNIVGNNLFVRPYSLIGIQGGLTFTHKGTLYNIRSISIDYSSTIAGNNATMNTLTDFAIGKITGVKVVNSGYGYIDQAIVTLLDDLNRPAVKARISARGQGETSGAWISYNSHIGNEFGKVLQDSFYYQDYSYEIQSKLGINTYEKPYKDIVHVSGTKLFGKFDFEDIIEPKTKISLTIED
jgi:hypothetical protein